MNFETSASSRGRMRSSASTIVTFVPYDAYTSANSMPIAPAPTMKSDPGASFCMSAPVDDQIRSSSIFSVGRSLGRDPVAMMTLAASWTVRLPSDDSTSTFPGPFRRPKPERCVTLFFLKRCATPFVIWATTRRLRS